MAEIVGGALRSESGEGVKILQAAMLGSFLSKTGLDHLRGETGSHQRQPPQCRFLPKFNQSNRDKRYQQRRYLPAPGSLLFPLADSSWCA